MPGFNGTGPRGMGRMTGRGLGYCATPGTNRGFAGRSLGWKHGLSRPLGWGRGMGFGRGMGLGRGVYGAYGGAQGFEDPAASPQDELTFLRDQARGIEDELKRIQDRIDELS